MTFNNYVPPKTYAFLVKMAEEHGLSTKEVQRILLNKPASDLGFRCDHLRIGFAKKDPQHRPFCKDCWSRMESVDETFFDGNRIKKKRRYRPLETFLDIHYREQSKNWEGLIFKSRVNL